MKRTWFNRGKLQQVKTIKAPKSGMKKVNERRRKKREAAYAKYIQSPEWKAIRKEALKRADFRCEMVLHGIRCPATTRTEMLTVHHRTYARFGGAELPEDIQTLCKPCHDRVHALEGKRIA
jgi:5-methylcytosine-specific restriction endonuclease McrA